VVIPTFVLNVVANTLTPGFTVASGLRPGESIPAVLIQVLAVVTLLVVIPVVGLVVERTASERHVEAFHSFVESLPGVGSVYTSFNEMSDLLLDSDTRSFRDLTSSPP